MVNKMTGRVARESRQKVAEENAEKRSRRSNEEQIEALNVRLGMGGARKERARLAGYDQTANVGSQKKSKARSK